MRIVNVYIVNVFQTLTDFSLRLLSQFHPHLSDPIAIYRDDLHSEYVAYWMEELNRQYVVIASSSVTCTYDASISK